MRTPTRHLIIGALFVGISALVGLAGYRIAGWGWADAVYMVVITIFGVGYGEVKEMGDGLHLFTIFFIIFGCTSLIYLFGAFINWLTEGQLQILLGRRKMQHDIELLTDHTIICGFGRIGRMLAADLQEAGKPFCVIDNSEERTELLKSNEYLYVNGDATNDRSLLEAGVERAETLATVLPSDAGNVYITLSARNLNSSLIIISRGSQPDSEAKLRQAGANRVVLPAHIGAERIANHILKPSARDLLDEELSDGQFLEGLAEIGLHIEEFPITVESGLDGVTLEELETQNKSAFIVVAIKRRTGETITKPPLDSQLHIGDILIVICHQGFVAEFAKGKPSYTYRGASTG